jgi:hypothetical protein
MEQRLFIIASTPRLAIHPLPAPELLVLAASRIQTTSLTIPGFLAFGRPVAY